MPSERVEYRLDEKDVLEGEALRVRDVALSLGIKDRELHTIALLVLAGKAHIVSAVKEKIKRIKETAGGN